MQRYDADWYKSVLNSMQDKVLVKGPGSRILWANASLLKFWGVAEDDLRRVPAALRHRVTEQDSTDFEKALGAIDAPVVLAVGFLGARVDHQLAAMHTLIAVSSPPSILLGASEVIFHVPPALDIPCAAGEVVSLFPLGPVTGRSQGLEWPIDGLDFAPGRLIGTSNRALGPVQLWMDGPGMIGIVPRRHLAALTQALAAAPRFSLRHAPSDAL